MSSIFGGSKSKQSSQSTSSSQNSSLSYNQAYPFLQSQYGGQIALGNMAGRAISSLLGIGGQDDQAQQGFDDYKNSTGYNFMMDSGQRAINNNKAVSGLLNSGSTLKALTQYGQNVGSQYFNNYLDRLLGVNNAGLQAGGLLGGAGGVSSSQGTSTSQGTSYGTSSSTNGFGGFLGSMIGSIAASDRRIKKNIFKIGELKNGLNLYQYRYIDNSGPFIGVMADEVEKIIPEALGPEIGGYKTVNYGKIEGIR